MSEPSQLEREVLKAVAGRDRERSILEQQILAAEVVSRDYTGVGFYTTFRLPEQIPLLDESRWRTEDMPDGFASHPSLPSGAHFILWLRNGRMVTLEGVTIEGDWPDDESQFRVAV